MLNAERGMLITEREIPRSEFLIPHSCDMPAQRWKYRLFLAQAIGALLIILPCIALGADDWGTETFSGDWNGTRSAWSEKGINTELLFKGTLMTSPAGGIRQGSDYMQLMELKLGLDTAKLSGIPDSSAYLHVVLNNGGRMNAAYVGSLMGVDNSEVSENNPKLYQAWFNKNFFSSTLSVLAGVYPVDTEFYVTDSSGIFIHPSFGMAAELAQTGKNGPSVYPFAALGVRVKYQPSPIFYAQAAMLDGNPGGGRKPHWTRINPFHGDGSLLIAEVAYSPGEAHHMTDPNIEPGRGGLLTTAQRLEQRYEPIGKYAVGYWFYSKRFDDLFDSDPAGNPLQRKNRGIYLLMENSLYRPDNMERDVTAFFRYGQAEKNVNIFDYSVSIGLRVRGLITGRVDDFFGFSATSSHAGEKFRLAQQAAGINIPGNETAVEITYRTQFKPWLVIQPNLQRVFNTGLAPGIKNATVLGLRCEISI
ncbi:MAG: carbohydrate porin [Gallionella sp.]|jgi:porin